MATPMEFTPNVQRKMVHVQKGFSVQGDGKG